MSSSERGSLPDAKFAALSSEAGDLLEEINLLLTPPVEKIADNFFTFFNTKALWTAVKLRIPDLLATGPKHISKLAQLANADETRLHQVLRLLAGRGNFNLDSATSIYANNASSVLLARDHWTQWWQWTEVYGMEYYGMAEGLPDCLGKDCQRTAAQIYYGNDKSIFQHFSDTKQMGGMLECIKAGGLSQAPGMVSEPLWGEIAERGEVLVDIGGGSGGFMASLLRAHPGLKGEVLDQEGVIEVFKESFGEGGQFADVGGRCELVVGDFFRAETIPRRKFYCIRWCLHNWVDADVVRILGSVREAVVEAPESRFVLIEAVLTEGKTGIASRYDDVAMMTSCSGRQRSHDEWKRVVEPAGWELVRATPLRNTWVSTIELRPVSVGLDATNGANGHP
ncbi:hypothetical protein OQA88_4785 [Cercophora sp. LCS_1]